VHLFQYRFAYISIFNMENYPLPCLTWVILEEDQLGKRRAQHFSTLPYQISFIFHDFINIVKPFVKSLPSTVQR
jgi:hypothetical protein